MILHYLSDVAMVGFLALAAVVCIGYASHRIDAAFEAGTFVLMFWLVLAFRDVARSLTKLYNLLGGRDEPVSETFRAWIQHGRQIFEEMGRNGRE